MYLLDTNVISELRKTSAGRANSGVVSWANDQAAELMFMSAISLHELEHGVLLAEHNDTAKGTILRAWLTDDVVPAFSSRILAVDASIATTAAALHVPDPAPFRDALIGATALVHQMTLISRNTRDFDRFEGLTVLNPWTHGS